MQIFPIGKIYDFMGARRLFAAISIGMTVFSIVAVFVYPKPSLGTDFQGGTEVEGAFAPGVEASAVRKAVADSGFDQPEVIGVEGARGQNRFMIRVHEITTLEPAQQAALAKALCVGEGLSEAECPEAKRGSEFKLSPGGDKLTLRYRETPDLAWVKERASSVNGVAVREGEGNPSLQNARENKVEIQLKSKGDQLLDGLRTHLGVERAPDDKSVRVEWIGPKAGAQLRDSAMKSIGLAVLFIMIYIAFRFDLRFAPGAVFSMAHDALGTLALLIVLGREVNLTTVAAILTIMGYSVNDTVVVYDRVRENFGIMRGATFESIINTSISEMLGRTILTSLTTVLSLLAFFTWGTGPLKDFALALVIGVSLGTYSSVYVAVPFTWWLDRLFFAKKDGGTPGPQKRPQKKAAAVV